MDKETEAIMEYDEDEVQLQQLQPCSIETITTTDTENATMSFCEDLSCNELLRKLREQRDNDCGTDITLFTKGQRFKAHRSVLSASSPFFETILKNNRTELTISIPLAEGFDIVLDYMYTGILKVDWNNVESLLKLASHFSIVKLRCYCEEFLDKFISVDTCLKVRKFCELYTLERISECCSNFIHEHLSEVLSHESFLDLSFKRLENFLTDPEIGCDNVPLGLLLYALTKWLNQDLSNRTIDYQKLLMIINWSDYHEIEILNYIDNESLFKENQLCLYFILNTLEINGILIDSYASKYEELKKIYEVEEQREIVAETTEKSNENSLTLANESTVVFEAPSTSESKQEIGKRPRGRPRRNQIKTQESTSNNEVQRPGKRQVKKRFDSQDWVTDDNLKRRKSSMNESNLSTNENVVLISEQPSISKTHLDKSKKSAKSKPETVTLAASSADEEISSPEKKAYDEDNFDSDAFVSDIDDVTKLDMIETNDLRTEFKVRGKKHSATMAEWRKGVKCPNCCYIGHSASRLEHHLAKVHQEDTTYECRMCAFTCKWNREFYKHMKNHFNGPPYRCPQCDYTCDRIQFILSHQMRHTDEKPFFCDKCSFRSRTRGNLLVHFRVHTGERPYQCHYCDKRFAMKNTLDQHMATHRDDRPYLCDACGFTTKYQSHLLSHRRIHTGNVYRCQHEGCSYSSPRRSQLAAHTRSHLSIRTHICSTCGRAFIERSHLIRHERIHLEEKPFKCEHCEYGSTRRDKLKEHVMKHHDQNPPEKQARPRRRKSDKLVSFSHPVQINGQPISITLGKDVFQLQPNVPQNVSFAIGDQLYESQIVVSNGKQAEGEEEIQITNVSEQDLADAPLIYEYANGELAIANGRILIQNGVDFVNDPHAVIIEQKDVTETEDIVEENQTIQTEEVASESTQSIEQLEQVVQ